MIWEVPRNKTRPSILLPPDQDTQQQQLQGEETPNTAQPLPWLVAVVVVFMLIGVAVASQITAQMVAPYAEPFKRNLLAVSDADYTPWHRSPNLAALNPESAEAEELTTGNEFEDFAVSDVEVVQRPDTSTIIFLPMSKAFATDDDPDSPAVQSPPTPAPTTPQPTATATATPILSPEPTASTLPFAAVTSPTSEAAATETEERTFATRTPQPVAAVPEDNTAATATSEASATSQPGSVPNIQPTNQPAPSEPDQPTARPTRTPEPEEDSPAQPPGRTSTTPVVSVPSTNTPEVTFTPAVPPVTPSPTPGSNGIIAITAGYRPGDTLEITLEDTDLNTSSSQEETVQVVVRNEATGETEPVILTATGIDSATFIGNLETEFRGDEHGDGNNASLKVKADDTITAIYEDTLSASGFAQRFIDRIIIEGGNDGIVDINAGSGEGAALRVGVLDADLNANSSLVERVPVTLINEQTRETEIVFLTEISPNSSIFTGDLMTAVGDSPGQNDDGVLRVQSGQSVSANYFDGFTKAGNAQPVTDALTIASGNDGIVAITPGSRPGDALRVGVSDADLNADPTLREVVDVTVVNDDTDEQEILTLTETSPDNEFFTGSLPTIFATDTGIDDDGILHIEAGHRVTVTYEDERNTNGVAETMTDSEVIAAGSDGIIIVTPGSRPGDTLEFGVVDDDLNTDSQVIEQVEITVVNNTTREVETVVLREITEEDSFFTGSLPTVASETAGTDNDGALHTNAEDTVTATYIDELARDGDTATRTDTITLLPLPVVQLSAPDYIVAENVVGGNAHITATLNITPTGPVAVDYATSDDTATASDDYIVVSDTLRFAAGQRRQSFTVPIINDNLGEADERVIVRLMNPTGATLGEPANTSLIIADDDMPAVQFAADAYRVDENTRQVTLTVELDTPSSQEVVIEHTPMSGTATNRLDYTNGSGTLIFAPGETSKTFVVGIRDDAFDEADEQVTLRLLNPVNASLGSQSTSTINIIDDDQPQADFSTVSYNVREDAGQATITVTLDITSTREITVEYSTDNGDATAGEDYIATSDTLTFAPGQSRDSFTVPILADDIDEQNEMVQLRLSMTGDPSPDSTRFATLTIIDNNQPMVAFGAEIYTVDEQAQQATITVTLDTAPAQTVSVDYATTDGSATAGEDYTLPRGTLTFAPGEMSKTFDVAIADDNLGESDETIALALSDPQEAKLGNQSTSTLRIIDDDEPTVQFASSLKRVREDEGQVTVTVELSNPSTEEIVVAYEPVGGSADDRNDYANASGTVTFAPGETVQNVQIDIIDDEVSEADETLILALSNVEGATPGGESTTTVAIIDDDLPTIAFEDTTYVVDEQATATARIGVVLDMPSAQQVSVNYVATGGSATAGEDYEPINGTLVFTPGVTLQTIDIEILGDELPEADETIVLQLSTPLNADLVDPDTATITIEDDDEPLVQFETRTYRVGEDDTRASITVLMDVASSEPVTVSYGPTGGTAIMGTDYITTSGTLTFGPGQTVRTFEVGIIDDNLSEANETAIFSLSTPENALLGERNTTTLTIEDDDQPEVAFSTTRYTVAEDGGMAPISATLSAASTQPITVTYTTREATATADNDYIPARGSMVFAPGQTTATFTVMVRDDEQVEDDESISLALEGVVNATLGEPDQATLVIRDNDEPQPVPEVRFSATDYVVAEDGGTALISITLSAARTQPVTVTYRTQDGSATAGADYTAVSESLTFAPGQTTATFMVTVRDDDKVEGDETVELVLVTVENASISEGRGRATLTIADNDQPLPQVSFSAVSYAVDEDSDTAYITTTLSAASTRPITVTYATQDDSATAGTDYITASGRLDFAPGQTTATFMVTVRDDDKVEGDETVELVLVAAENATLGEQNTAMLIILDNEQEPEPEALRLDRARGSGQTASFWPLAARNICRASSVLPHCYRYG